LNRPLLLLALFLPAALPLFSQELALENGYVAEAGLEYPLANGEPEEQEAQEAPPPYAAEAQEAEAADDRVFVIAAFDLDIRGRTRPYALKHNARLRVGDELRGRAALDAYVRDRTQVITNMRVLRDNVEMSYSIGERLEDGRYPVTFMISVEDTWAIIALPIPEYNSNTGFELDVRARDYNFFGTMNPLRVDFGYRFNQYRRSSFEIMIDSSIPFTAHGYRWNFRFVNTFRYRPGVEEPFFFRNLTGISVEIPWGDTRFTVGFEESFILNEENPRRQREEHGYFQRGLYMSSRAFANWRIPTGFTTANFGEVTYNINPSVTFNHELPGMPLDGFRRGPFATIGHSLGFGRANWHGNFRRGLSFWLSNAFNYDFARYDRLQDPFSVTLSLEGTGHFILTDFLGISARVMSRRWFFFDGRGYHEHGGDVLRGIPDTRIQADYMFSLNLNMPFRAMRFAPSQWFGISRMRLFDFDLHISPMLDIALFDDPRPGQGRDVAASGGLEFVVFPAFMRALFLRASVGIDALHFLSNMGIPSGNYREISITIGHFF